MAPTKTKVLATAPSAGDVERAYQAARDTITNKLGISVGKLAPKDLAAIGAQVTQTKKNADFHAAFDGTVFTFSATVGQKRTAISAVNVDALGDAATVYAIKKQLALLGLAAAPVDPAVLASMRKAIEDIRSGIQSSNGVSQSYQSFTWDTESPSMHGALEEWAKKNNRAPLIDFLGDVKAKAKAQTIFDTYVKKGAPRPVNLSSQVAAAIEKDLKAGKTPNFTAAEKEVLTVVKTKVIPAFKKWGLDGGTAYVKQMKAELAKLEKQLAAATGK